MAARRSSNQVEARERARAATAARREREQRLEDLVSAYFVADGEIDTVEGAATEKIESYAKKVRAEADQATGRLRTEMDVVVADMLKIDGIRAVAGLLGISEALVREAKARVGDRAAPAETPPRAETPFAPAAVNETRTAETDGPVRDEPWVAPAT